MKRKLLQPFLIFCSLMPSPKGCALLLFLCMSFYAQATTIYDKAAVSGTSGEKPKSTIDNPPFAPPTPTCPYLIVNGVSYDFISAQVFGATSYNVTAEVVLVENGVCNGINENLTGKIALIRREACAFIFKAIVAQQAGAIGVIMYNDRPGSFVARGADSRITIPVVTISQADGNAVIAALGMGPVTATLYTNLPKPTLSPGTSPAICQGATSFTIPYTAPVGSPNTYSISGAGITTVTNAPLPANAITVNLSSGATGSSIGYTLTVKNSDDCVSNNITGSVAVNPAPTRFYVNAAAIGANTGLTWTDAFTDLQSALNYTCSGNLTEIWVAKGTYKPALNTSFSMLPNVAILGGFPDTGNPSLTDRNWSGNPTILQGNGSRVITNDDNGLNTSSILDGFTVTGGVSNFGAGGGVQNFGVSPTFLNCIFSGNSTGVASGGGMSIVNGSPILTNCIFIGNTSRFDGGGLSIVFNGLTAPIVTNCTFSGNEAANGRGGGVSNCGGTGQFNNCIIWGNTSGFLSTNCLGAPTLSNSLIEGQSIGNGIISNSNPLFVSQPSIGLGTAGDLRLLPCSPAINAGNDAANTTTTDLAGNNRKFGTIDLGAYELQRQPFSASSTTISANNLLCEGSSIRLSSSGGNSYAWAGPNFTSTLQNPTRLRASVNMSGIYSLTVSAGICSVVLTTSVVVSPNVAPSITSLQVNNLSPNAPNNTVAICNSAAVSLNIAATNAVTYSWRGPTGAGSGFTSSLVSPVTMPIASPRQGQYTVTVRNGCTVFNQRVINIQLISCSNNTRLASAEDTEGIEMEINAYPNPVSKTLTVEVRLKEAQPLQLKLLNSLGQTSGTWQLSEPSTVHRTELNLSDLTGGVYLLEAQAGEQRVVKKVVKVE